MASIRHSYFVPVGIHIPTFGLVCIQFALAVAAVGTTMALTHRTAAIHTRLPNVPWVQRGWLGVFE